MQARLHFGNPLTEQRDFAKGEAVVFLEQFGVVSVSGEDRLSWLHSLLSQDIKNLKPGDSTEALLLDPQGHIEAQLAIIDDGVTTWLITEQKQVVLAWLSKMVFRMRVEVKDQDLKVIAATKPIPSIADAAGGIKLIWEDPFSVGRPGGYRYSKQVAPYANFLHLAKNTNELAGLAQSGSMAFEAIRIAAGKTASSELDEKVLPHELDLLGTAVHLSKGCYRGQETIAKVHNLGHPPRRLTFLHLDGSGHLLPESGSEIRVAGDEKIRGRITSSANHFEMGPIALCLLQRQTPEDAVLEVISGESVISASQQVIVPKDAGQVANVPKLPRLNLGAKSSPPRSQP
jgi:tRNA-modifying protein YgfZ